MENKMPREIIEKYDDTSFYSIPEVLKDSQISKESKDKFLENILINTLNVETYFDDSAYVIGLETIFKNCKNLVSKKIRNKAANLKVDLFPACNLNRGAKNLRYIIRDKNFPEKIRNKAKKFLKDYNQNIKDCSMGSLVLSYLLKTSQTAY